jgi:hypothetical protein
MSFVSKEDIMVSLKSLTTLPQIQADPVMGRRNRTIAHLEEQKRLLQDPSYARTVKVWIEKDGERQQVEKKQRIFPWWRASLQVSIQATGDQYVSTERRPLCRIPHFHSYSETYTMPGIPSGKHRQYFRVIH